MLRPEQPRRQGRSAQGVVISTHRPGPAGPPPVRPTSPPTYWRCEPGWSWRARPLPDYLLWCVLDGLGWLVVGGERCTLTRGMCVVFAPGDEPVAGHDPLRRLLVFGMHFETDPPAVVDAVVPPGRWCQVRDQSLLAALAARCEAGYRRGDPLGARQHRLCLEEILCLLWEDATLPPPGPTDAVLDEITRAIREDPARRWTLADMARRTSLSRAQFTRRFTARAGLSPTRYLISARIDRARDLLTETGMSVSQVAATLGYPDVASFSRQFRRQTGEAPRDVRARTSGPRGDVP